MWCGSTANFIDDWRTSEMLLKWRVNNEQYRRKDRIKKKRRLSLACLEGEKQREIPSAGIHITIHV